MPQRNGGRSPGELLRADRTGRACLRLALERSAAGKPLLILGPAGSGKTLLAGAVHAARGAGGTMKTMHCGAIPGGSQPAELRRGLAARGGTLLVKEICSLSAAAQALLAQAVAAAGSGPSGPMIICTTARDFQAAAAAGKIIPPLFERLRGRTVPIPPLSERNRDILPLMKKLAPGGRRPSLTRGAVKVLKSHDWPGNVRELKMFLRIAMCRGGIVTAAAALDCLGLNFF